jgi:hypothetical protein
VRLTVNSEIRAADDDFFSRALGRTQRIMFVLGIAGFVIAFVVFGWRIGVGFAVGAVVAYVNFYWLEKIVAGVAESTSGTASASKVTRKFVIRYALMALVAFVILTVSRESLYGLFAGLFLPVAAILCEAVYETYITLDRGT